MRGDRSGQRLLAFFLILPLVYDRIDNCLSSFLICLSKFSSKVFFNGNSFFFFFLEFVLEIAYA